MLRLKHKRKGSGQANSPCFDRRAIYLWKAPQEAAVCRAGLYLEKRRLMRARCGGKRMTRGEDTLGTRLESQALCSAKPLVPKVLVAFAPKGRR